MNVQAYNEAMEQRLQLRRDLRQRVQQIRDATNALGAAAGGVQPSAPSRLASGEPLGQIDHLCSGASALTQMLRRNQSEIIAAEQALCAARTRAQRIRLLAIAGGVLAVLAIAAALLMHQG
jgi:hypothetical protein